nr:hypothetical protein [Planctomycetales bacterium]
MIWWIIFLLTPLVAVAGVVLYVWVRVYPTATQGAARIAPLPPAVKSA